jgi:predicted nucleic acid-binding protein
VRVADTSALYALLSATDAHHTEARRAFADPEPVLVPTEIWSETLALVQFRHGHAAAVAATSALRALPHLEVQPTPDDPFEDILALAERLHRESDRKISPPDAIVAAWCRRRRLGCLAYDQALLREAAA